MAKNSQTAAGMTAGIFTRRIRRLRLIMGSLPAALSATIILAMDINTPFNLAAITAIGLAIAPILPALLSGTEERVGKEHAPNTIGFQIAAMSVGGGGHSIPYRHCCTAALAGRHPDFYVNSDPDSSGSVSAFD